jgi:hypothetical protein
MSNKKQTAVEWLYEHLFPQQIDGFSEDEWNKIDTAFEQAKAMEKEQMKNVYSPPITMTEDGLLNVVSFENYYKETYE